MVGVYHKLPGRPLETPADEKNAKILQSEAVRMNATFTQGKGTHTVGVPDLGHSKVGQPG